MSDQIESLGIRKLLVLPGYALFFLMLTYPMVLSVLYVKAVLFGIVLTIIGIVSMLDANWRLNHEVALWTLLLAGVSFFFVLRGYFLGTPGATKAAEVYVLWPLVYLVLVAGASRPNILVGLHRVLVLATIFIGVQGGIYLLSHLNILPENRYSDLLSLGFEAQAIGSREGYIGMQFPGLNSLPFLIPFTFAALATPALPGSHEPVRKIWLWLAYCLGLLMMLTSGRRALILVTLSAPAFIWLFIRFKPVKEKILARSSLTRLVIVLAVGLVVFLAGLSLFDQFEISGLIGRVSQGFEFGAGTVDEGGAARHEQYFALLRGWYQNPLLGAGHGASVYGSIRSEERPWAYELSYMALLFQCGLLGFAAYAAGVVWIYWKGIGTIRDGGRVGQSIFPLMVGMTCYLIANATNPYLSRFDGIWAIFLPLAFINYALVTRNEGVQFTSKYSSAA